MSSLTNSETTPSLRREIKKFTKYGTEYTLGVVYETRPEWAPVYRRADGSVIDTTQENWIAALNGETPVVSWEKNGKTLEASYVEFARAKEEGQLTACPIYLFSTLDGPILGIETYNAEDGVILEDPCIIRYDADKGIVHYMPIFNVARTLHLTHNAIRSKQAPAELLIANYPGFVIQNRMYKYQIKPTVPFAVTQAAENTAEELVAEVGSTSAPN